MNLSFFAGPLIGAIIGYCTNYIAVKMLFFPKKEIHLFGHRLPFTPGAIPKGKPRLAKAIGEIVGTTLITKEDMEAKIMSEDVINGIADVCAETLAHPVKESIVAVTNVPDEQYQEGKEKLAVFMGQEIADSLSKMDLSGVIAEKGGAIVKERVRGTMLEMFLSDELIFSVTGPIGTELQQMITAEGAEYMKPYLVEKINDLEENTGMELLSKLQFSENDVKCLLSDLLRKAISPLLEKMFACLDITGIVQTKVNDMSVDELESLVLTVMKKELNMIVNLGALIGFLLGMLNLIL